MATNLKKYTVQEALNAALNTGGDALKVDIDNVTLDGSQLSVDLDSADDSVTSVPTTASATVKTADAQVKGSAGTVWSVMVSMNGVTAGDKVEIKNSIDNSGAALLTFTATATAQSFMFSPSVGVAYSSGIYSDETKTGGTITVTVVYS